MTPKTKQVCALLAGPLVAAILLMIDPLPGLTPLGMKALAGALWFLIWLMFEPISLVAASVWAVVIFVILGVTTPKQAFSYFGTPTIMLLFGATMILGVWTESNFIQRYSIKALTMPFIKGKTKNFIFAFVAAASILSCITPNIPVVILFCTLATTIAKEFNIKPGEGNLIRMLCVLSLFCANVGGIATPLGGAPNMTTIAMTSKMLNTQIEFWQWCMIGIPVAAAVMLVSTIVCFYLFPLKENERHTLPFAASFLREKEEKLGPISRYEKIAVVVMAFAMFMWVVVPPLMGPLGLKKYAALTGAPFVAMAIAALLLVIPVRTDEKTGRFVFAMSWPQSQKNILWGVLVLIMASTLMGDALVKGGIDKWMASGISNALGDISTFWAWTSLVFLTGFVSQFAANSGTITLFVPITVALAPVYGFHPLAACITVGIAANLASMFPFSAPPVAVAVESSGAYIKPTDFAIGGFIILVLGTAAIMAVAWPLAGMIFPPM
ncbi:MAG: SLC13 family permease [Mailhella sp.]|nr:SLC13 family permease [Mailhella sp.]